MVKCGTRNPERGETKGQSLQCLNAECGNKSFLPKREVVRKIVPSSQVFPALEASRVGALKAGEFICCPK